MITYLDEPLNTLAARADRAMEIVSPLQVDVVSTSDDRVTELATTVTELTQQFADFLHQDTSGKNTGTRRQQTPPVASQQSSGMCYFHIRFGENSHNYRPPCSSNSGSKPSTQS